MNGKMKIPCEIYSRITGYYRPIQSWNAGKREEYEHRQVFDAKKIGE